MFDLDAELRDRALSGAQPWLVGLAALTLAGAIARFATLDLQSFYLDETVTAGLMQQGLADMLDTLPASESAPPLYYVLLWPWAQVWGTGEVGLRSFSALAGTATIPVAYLAASRLGGTRPALVCAALIAFNPLLVWYSQEARVYALYALLAAATLLAFTNLIREPGRRALLWWLAAAAAAMLTHYYAIFLIAPQAAILYALRVRRRELAIGCGGLAGLELLLAPLAIAQRGGTDWITENPLIERVADTIAQFLIGPNAPAPELVGPLTAALAAAGGWLLWNRAAPRERPGGLWMVAIGATAIALPLLLALGGPDVFIQKSLIGALPPLLIVLAIGFGSRRARRAGPGTAAALCVVWLGILVAVATTSTLQRDEWRGAAEAIGAAPHTRVLAVNPADAGPPHRQAIEFYLPRSRATDCEQESREVDLLSLEDNGLDAQIRGVPELPPVPPPPGFELAERLETDRYTLLRFRSDAARPTCGWIGSVDASFERVGRSDVKLLSLPAGSGRAEQG